MTMHRNHHTPCYDAASRRLVGLAGIAASLASLSLVTLLFWNSSRHAVDAPSYIARMQHCHTLPAAATRQRCVDETFARAIASPGERQYADARPR
jgi:hypothetical protein